MTSGKAFLTEEQVAHLKAMLRSGQMTHQDLAWEFCLTRVQVTNINRGASWKYVPAATDPYDRTRTLSDQERTKWA